MKGVREYHGNEKVALILVNNGGHDRRTIARADDYVKRYGVDDAPRVRFDEAQFASQVVATFGHRSYGQIVIDEKGTLLGVNVIEPLLEGLVASACSAGDPLAGLEGFALNVAVGRPRGGRGLFNLSETLPKDVTGTITVSLTIPEGWYVSRANGPTKLHVDYAGALETGAPVMKDADRARHTGSIRFDLPVTAKQGTPIGRYLIFGHLQFVACNAEGCLPPLEVPWKVVVDAL